MATFLQRDVDLSTLNTFRLAGVARYFAEINDVASLQSLINSGLPADCQGVFVLGGGSNVIISEYYPGLVLRVNIRGRELQQDDESNLLCLGAGENWHETVVWALANNAPGLENLALIPGSVGAAPVQNIGAYGAELKDFIVRLEAFDLTTGQSREFSAEDCRFAYRDSIFKHENNWFITRIFLRLPRQWRTNLGYADLATRFANKSPTPEDVFAAVVAIRREKLPDPSLLPNVGSFFKNPIVTAAEAERLLQRHLQMPYYRITDKQAKLAAAWLIDQCGWRGRQWGSLRVHERQALVITHSGGSSRSELEKLVARIQDDVLCAFGVELEPEPVFM